MSMELTRNQASCIVICCASLILISGFFMFESYKQAKNVVSVIEACNIMRNQIANDYDFNLVEYDLNKSQKADFNLMEVVFYENNG